jgi:hypothetical protein
MTGVPMFSKDPARQMDHTGLASDFDVQTDAPSWEQGARRVQAVAAYATDLRKIRPGSFCSINPRALLDTLWIGLTFVSRGTLVSEGVRHSFALDVMAACEPDDEPIATARVWALQA